MTRLLRVLCFIGALQSFYCCLAINPQFNHLGAEDGLSSNFVHCAYTDSYGYVWLGTEDGLDRFDGQNSKNFNAYFPIESVAVSSILENSKRNLWFGTDVGLFRWDRVSVRLERVSIVSDSLMSINEIISFGASKLFLATDLGLISYDWVSGESEKTLFHRDPTHPLNIVSDLLIYQDQLFATTMGGLVQYNVPDKIVIHCKDQLTPRNSTISSREMARYNQDIFVRDIFNRLWKYSLNDQTYYQILELAAEKVTSICIDRDLLLLGIATKGLQVYNLSSEESLTLLQDHFLQLESSAPISSIFVDQNDLLWVCSFATGISYAPFTSSKFETYTGELGRLTDQSIRSLHRDEFGNKFFGTRNGLYVVDKNEGWKHFEEDGDALLGSTILTFYRWGNDLLMGVVRGGVSQYSLETGELKGWQSEKLKNLTVHGIDQDSQENLWIGGIDFLIRRSSEGEMRVFDDTNSALLDRVIFSIKIDEYDRIWVAGGGGAFVYKYENGQLEHLKKLDMGHKNKSVALYLDDYDRMWVGTAKNGLYVFDMDLNLIRQIDKEAGLSGNTIASVLALDSVNYWLSTANGLNYYNFEKDRCTTCDISTGLPSASFCRGAAILDERYLWMGTEKGAVFFDPFDFPAAESKNPILISDLQINNEPWFKELPGLIDEPVEDVKSITLPNNDYALGFGFAQAGILHENHDDIMYRMIGQNSEWQQSSLNQKADYQSLSPGQYLFQVGLNDGAGYVDESTISSVAITIPPKWFQRASIRILGTLCFLSMITFFILDAKKWYYAAEKASINRGLKKKYELSDLDKETSLQILDKIKGYLEKTQVYLQSDLSVSDLSKAIGINTRHISQSINENLNQRFTHFINQYRIDEVKRRLADDQYKKYTLVAIAASCGLKSKSTFNRAFKKVTGQTPSEYLQKHHPHFKED